MMMGVGKEEGVTRQPLHHGTLLWQVYGWNRNALILMGSKEAAQMAHLTTDMADTDVRQAQFGREPATKNSFKERP